MILDGLLTFTGTSQGASGGIASGPQTDSPTTGSQDASNILDLGLLGIPTSASGGGARDIGIGDIPQLKINAEVTVAFAGGTSLQVEVQGAPDNGSGGQGAYTIMAISPAVAEAALIVGAQLWSGIAVPRAVWEQVNPRFLKLTFITVGTHTAGSVEANIVLDRFDQTIGAAGNLSGYPPGVVVAN